MCKFLCKSLLVFVNENIFGFTTAMKAWCSQCYAILSHVFLLNMMTSKSSLVSHFVRIEIFCYGLFDS